MTWNWASAATRAAVTVALELFAMTRAKSPRLARRLAFCVLSAAAERPQRAGISREAQPNNIIASLSEPPLANRMCARGCVPELVRMKPAGLPARLAP